jgi:hypothetical protein
MYMGVILFLGVAVAANPSDSTNRGGALAGKMLDMIKNPGTFGGRIAIWRVSGEVFLKNPIAGVGLGHYKWHFLEGQKNMFAKYPELDGNPDYKWQFTYWAHNEYLQWLCETGIIGTVLLVMMALWWLYCFFHVLFIKWEKMPSEAIWGIAMIFMLFSDALFSRPFHRIEIAVWMSLAFAISNRSILPDAVKWMARENAVIWRGFGVFVSLVSVCGLVFLSGGMRGDKLMLYALTMDSYEEKREFLDKAEWYLMSRDEAKEMNAQLDIAISLQTKDSDLYVRGIVGLYEAFKTRPNSERLFKLLDYAQNLDSTDLIKELASYLLPGTVKLGENGT